MQSEERFGLTKRHGYDEIVAWIKSDPKGVPYPNRVAFKTYDSPVYAQLRDSLKTNPEPQDAYAAYQHGGDLGPFVPPRPRFVGPPSGNPPNPPPDDDDDDLMGPPGPGPERYTTLLEPAPRPSDQVLINEGMQPPQAPPAPAAPSMVQQAGNSFAQSAGNAAGGAVGSAAGAAASAGIGALLSRAAAAAGMGAMEGAEAGPAGVLAGSAIGLVGGLIGDAVGGAVRRGFQPGGGSSQQPTGPPVAYGPGGLRERVQARPQENINRQQRSHNQGGGAPAAQVDFRTLNGQNDRKPRDRKVRFNNEAAESRTGVLGGAAASSSGPMVVAGGTTRPAAPLDPGGAKIPRNADPAPAAPPTYKDLVGKLKKAPEVKPFSNPVTPSRPRERSPPRGDRRPLGEQRRPKKESTALFPAGDGREEALSRRSNPKEFYIGDRGEKRKAPEPLVDRRKAPNQRQLDAKTAPRPAAVKRKATSGPADSQAKRTQPPGPPIGDRKIGKPRKARSTK
jgi:hypothetical protein